MLEISERSKEREQRMDESDILKIQKLYAEFEENPSRQLAVDIELKCDIAKLALGDRFYDLRHFNRISNEVSRYLDKEDLEKMNDYSAEELLGENTIALSKLFEKGND